jgi:hypothetical protein
MQVLIKMSVGLMDNLLSQTLVPSAPAGPLETLTGGLPGLVKQA